MGSKSDVSPIGVRCLSVSKLICTFADVKPSLSSMNKKIINTIIEVLRFVAALLAGYVGGSV